MATITVAQASKKVEGMEASWSALTAATSDVGSALDISMYPGFIALQAVGTYTGSSVVTMQVSNDGTNWITAKDTAGSDLTFGANGLKNLGIKAKYLRPSIATGTGVVAIKVVAVA